MTTSDYITLGTGIAGLIGIVFANQLRVVGDTLAKNKQVVGRTLLSVFYGIVLGAFPIYQLLHTYFSKLPVDKSFVFTVVGNSVLLLYGFIRLQNGNNYIRAREAELSAFKFQCQAFTVVHLFKRTFQRLIEEGATDPGLTKDISDMTREIKELEVIHFEIIEQKRRSLK